MSIEPRIVTSRETGQPEVELYHHDNTSHPDRAYFQDRSGSTDYSTHLEDHLGAWFELAQEKISGLMHPLHGLVSQERNSNRVHFEYWLIESVAAVMRKTANDAVAHSIRLVELRENDELPSAGPIRPPSPTGRLSYEITF